MEGFHGGIAFGSVALQCLHCHGRQCVGHSAFGAVDEHCGVGFVGEFGGCGDLAGLDFFQHLGSTAGEGRAEGENVIQNCTQRIDVGALVDGLEPAFCLLGGHKARSAHDGSVTGAAFGAFIGLRQELFVLIDYFGEAPVHDEDFAVFAEHDVGGLEVAMDDAFGVGVGDGITNFLVNAQQLMERVAVDHVGLPLAQAVENVLERGAPDVFHGVIVLAAGVHAEVVNGDDVGMVEPAQHEGFLRESPGKAGGGRYRGRH